MKPCSAFEESILLRATGALDPEQSAKLDAHLAGCVACRDHAQQLQQLLELGHPDDLPLPAVPGAFHQRLLARVRADARRRDSSLVDRAFGWIRIPRLAFASLIAIVLVVLALILWPPRSGDVPQPSSILINPPTPPTTQATGADPEPRFLTYRLALNKSIDDLDSLLARDARLSAPIGAATTVMAARSGPPN